MRNTAPGAAVKASRNVPQNYDYALFRFSDGVTDGTSTTTAADANPDNSWSLTLGNFAAAQWSDRLGYWTGTSGSSYYAELTKTGAIDKFKKFFHRDAVVGQSYLCAFEFSLPAYATAAAQRIVGAGINNNDEVFNVRYTSGDILSAYIGTTGLVLDTGIDITANVDTDLVGIVLIDDREGYKTAQFRVYLAGTNTIIDTKSVSTAGATWTARADVTEEYFTVGAKTGSHNNPSDVTIRRVLTVPFGTSPPADLTSILDRLAQSRLSRMDGL